MSRRHAAEVVGLALWWADTTRCGRVFVAGLGAAVVAAIGGRWLHGFFKVRTR